MKINYFIILVLLIILFLSSCTQQKEIILQKNTENTEQTEDIQQEQQEKIIEKEPIPETSSGKKVFTMTARRFAFAPDTIEVNFGDDVELHITSIDVTHGFTLSSFGISEVLKPNEEKIISFVADKRGTFLFSCSVPCGQGHSSMRGKLVVR